MQVPCELQFVGKDKRMCLLKKELEGKMILNEKRNYTELHEFSSEFWIKT